MTKDKVITLGPNELPILVSSSRLDDCNYLQWAQYICTTLKGCKKLSHIEGNDPPRDDPKFEAWNDEDFLILTWLWNFRTPKISKNYMFYFSIPKEKFPSLSEVFFIVWSEETQRSAMLDKGNSNTESAMVIR
ncbi:hypothetical protein CR513_36502, partial [Mucuna pruriens]